MSVNSGIFHFYILMLFTYARLHFAPTSRGRLVHEIATQITQDSGKSEITINKWATFDFQIVLQYVLLPLLYYRWIFGLFSLYESSHHTDNQKVNIQNWTCKQCVESNWFETNVCTLYIRHLSRLEFAWEWKWQCRHSFAKTCLRFTFPKLKLFHAIWKNCRGIRRAEISRSMHSCVRRRRRRKR